MDVSGHEGLAQGVLHSVPLIVLEVRVVAVGLIEVNVSEGEPVVKVRGITLEPAVPVAISELTSGLLS